MRSYPCLLLSGYVTSSPPSSPPPMPSMCRSTPPPACVMPSPPPLQSNALMRSKVSVYYPSCLAVTNDYLQHIVASRSTFSRQVRVLRGSAAWLSLRQVRFLTANPSQ